MAIGALGILGGFAGGAADAIQEGEKLRLQNNADQRAQEAHEEEMKVKRRDFANQAAFAQLSDTGDNSNLVYEGGNFPTPGYPTSAAAAGIEPGIGSLDRSRFATELQQKPWLKNHIMAVAAGENNDPVSNQAVLESMMNRAHMMGTSLEQESQRYDPKAGTGYYAGYNPGALNNPKTRAMIESNLDKVLAGSNVSNYATDNSSEGNNQFTTRRYASGMYAPTLDKPLNGEYFSRPSNSKARGYDRYDAWRQSVSQAAQPPAAQASEPISQPSQDDVLTQAVTPQPPAALPGTKTAALDTGTATDAAPAAALPSSVPAAVARVNGQPSPDDQVTQALAGTPNAPAPRKLGSDEVVVQDPHTGLYHAVPRAQTRQRNDLEKTGAVYDLLIKQGRVDEASRFLYNQTQAATMRNKLEIEQQNRELGVAAAAGPAALAEKATQIMQKNGMHGEVIPETLNGPDGQPVTVLKVNPKGTNGPPLYITGTGLSPRPDLSTNSYSGAVSALQGALSGEKIADTMANWVKFHTSVSQAREAASKADVQEATKAAQVEAGNLAPAVEKSKIAASQATADYHKGMLEHAYAATEAQRHENYGKAVAAGINSGAINLNDPENASKQMGILATTFGIKPQASFVTKPAAPAGVSPTASPFVNSAAGAALPAGAPAAPAAPQATALPAPRDNTASGLAKTLQGIPARQAATQQAQAQDAAAKEAEKAAKTALSGHDISAAQWRIYSSLQSGKAPTLSDVRAIHGVVTHFPGAAGLMNPRVLEYVQRYGG